MRTRLDEIVEEERACLNGWAAYPAGLHKIAERAFRHGVEQAHGVFAYLDPNGRNVQPAPAEEKPQCSCRSVGICCTPNVIHRTDGPCFMDSRKGERRKGTEDQACVLPPLDGKDVSPIYQFNSRMFWLRDRRTGKDRRE